MRLEKAAMVRVLHEEPAFSRFFINHLLTRTLRVEEDLVDQLFNSSERRLARTLVRTHALAQATPKLDRRPGTAIYATNRTPRRRSMRARGPVSTTGTAKRQNSESTGAGLIAVNTKLGRPHPEESLDPNQ
jgi:CRP-like cAMP-binding protein